MKILKAEFINGEIVMHEHKMKKHWVTSMSMSSQVFQYVSKNNLGEVGVGNVTLKFTRNDYEPDIVYFSKEKSKEFEDEQLVFPAPDLVVEILSESTKKRDRGIKFVDYAAHGVYEYWIVDPSKKSLEQYVLRNGEFYILGTHLGKFRTDTIKGLEIDVKTLFE